MATVSQRITQNMRRDILAKINKLPLKYFDSHSTGDVLSRVTNDVDTVGQTMNQSFSTLVSSVSLLIGSVLMMFLTNWIMAVTGIAAALIGFVGILFIISKSQKYFVQQQQELGGLNGQVEETYSGLAVVKAYNGGRKAKDEFHQRYRVLFLLAQLWRLCCTFGCSRSHYRIFPKRCPVCKVWRPPVSVCLNFWMKKKWKMKAIKL